jgi:hypothetical protein
MVWFCLGLTLGMGIFRCGCVCLLGLPWQDVVDRVVSRHLFLIALESGKFEIKYWQSHFLITSSQCPPLWGAGYWLVSFSHRDAVPWAPGLRTSSSPTYLLLMPSPWG